MQDKLRESTSTKDIALLNERIKNMEIRLDELNRYVKNNLKGQELVLTTIMETLTEYTFIKNSK
jgi:hypothetical protein